MRSLDTYIDLVRRLMTKTTPTTDLDTSRKLLSEMGFEHLPWFYQNFSSGPSARN